MSVRPNNGEDSNTTNMDAKLRATPIARLKRRILQRRPCVSPVRSNKSGDNVGKSQRSSTGQIEITQLHPRPVTPSTERPKTPTSLTVSNRSSSIFTKPLQIKLSIDDEPRQRAKTPQPRQRPEPQSYLERWKTAQLNPRSCTALGLLSPLESGATGDQAKGNLGRTHKVDFPQVANRHSRQIRVTGDATIGRNMMFSPAYQPELWNANPSIPTTIFLSQPRPVTSLGILTLSENNINPTKSVQFHIEESSTRSSSGSTLLQHRPKTPAAFVDRIRPPLAFGDKTPGKAQQSELSSKSQTSFNMFDIVPGGITDNTHGVVKPGLLPKSALSPEMDNTHQHRSSSMLSKPRRFVIASSKDVKARSLTKESYSSSNEHVGLLEMVRDSPVEDNRTSRSDKVALFRKKVANIVPRAIKLPRSVTPQPRQSSENMRFEVVRRQTPPLRKGTSVYSAMWQEENRGMDNCDIEASDTSAPHIRRGKTTKLILSPATTLIQDNTDNDCDKEDRILSWLGDCEGTTISTYLPTLTSENQGTHS